ncbi:MAG TPA: histidine phosphatase family protein, partial [Acidimicrobiia bacterium]|nr:histidine phosphatase family protein [Acidimicrobiia bacterium]
MPPPPSPESPSRPPWARPGLELWLIRHGETDWSRDSRFNGWTDVPLSDTGRLQAAALQEHLAEEQPAQAWTSDLVRCRETAALAGIEATVDNRLRELDFGLLEGLTWDQLPPSTQQSLVEFDDFAAPEGESVARFRSRVHHFLSQLGLGRHVISTHGGVIRLICRELNTD